MINPATKSKIEANEFTQRLIDNPKTMVKLRNGFYTRVSHYIPENEDEFEHLFSPDISGISWEMNGVCINSTNYDMMEIDDE